MIDTVIETVKEHCAHKDCRYRMTIAGNDPICDYADKAHKIRGCKISECDKYVPRKRGCNIVRIKVGV